MFCTYVYQNVMYISNNVSIINEIFFSQCTFVILNHLKMTTMV